MQALGRFFDKIVTLQAQGASLLMILLVIIMCMEVFLRYFLSSPTVWALEFTTFLYGVHFILGYGYTEHFHGHVNVDIFITRFSTKVQDVLYIITTIFISLPVCLLLCIWAYDNAWLSTKTLEHSPSAWGPPIWPVKILMAIGFTFLVLQIISNLIKRLNRLTSKKSTSQEGSIS